MRRTLLLLFPLCVGCPPGNPPGTDPCAIGDEESGIGPDEVSVFGLTPREMVQMPLGVRTPEWDASLEVLGETVELDVSWALDDAVYVRFTDERCPDFVEVTGQLTLTAPRFEVATTTITATLSEGGLSQRAVRDDLVPLAGEEAALLDLLPVEGQFVEHSWTATYSRQDAARPVLSFAGTTRRSSGVIDITVIAEAAL